MECSASFKIFMEFSKKENHCLHFTLKFEMQEAGYA